METKSPNPEPRQRWLKRGILAAIGIASILLISFLWFSESERTLERRCRLLRLAKNWTELAEVTNRWTRRNPKSADAWLFRAEAAQAMDEFEVLAESLGQVPAEDSRALLARVERVNVLFEKLNRPQEAAATCHEILKMDPRVTIARQRLIFFYALTLQRADLIREIREAIEVQREPREAYVYLVGAHWLNFSNLYELNTKWLQSDPDNENYQVARAMQVYNSNAKDNPDRAPDFEHIPEPDQLFKQFPNNVEVIAYQLDKKMAAGDIDAIQKILSNLPDEADRDARIWLVRGWVNESLGDLDAADHDLKKSLEIDPYGWQTYHSMADVCRRRGQKKDVEHYEKLYQQGKKLREVIIKLQDASSTPPETLKQILEYADQCGDKSVVQALRNRLQE